VLNFPYQVYLEEDFLVQNGDTRGELRLPKYSHKIITLPQDYENKDLYIKIYNQEKIPFIGSDLVKFRINYEREINGILFKNIIKLPNYSQESLALKLGRG